MHRHLFLACLVLSLATATVAQTPPVARAENLLLVTYDGLRWQELFGGLDDAMLEADENRRDEMAALRRKYGAETPEARRAKLLPFFWNTIAQQGAIYGDADRGSLSRVTNGLNFSYPGYNEILTGAADPAIDSNDKRNNPNVNVLEWIGRQPGFEGRVAAFASWDVFPYILNADRSGLPVSAGWEGTIGSSDPDRSALLNAIQNDTPRYWDSVRFDVFTHQAAVEHIRQHQPRVIYVAYGETDDWAHSGRYDLYAEAAWRTDDFIGRLWELLQSIPQYRNTTALLITTDHGRGSRPADWTGHGRDLPESDRIWMAALGAGVPARGVVEGVATTQSQVAATAAALLGLDFRAARPMAAAPLALE